MTKTKAQKILQFLWENSWDTIAEDVTDGENNTIKVFDGEVSYDVLHDSFTNQCNQYEGTYQYFEITYKDEKDEIRFIGVVSNYPIKLVDIVGWNEEFYQECLKWMEEEI